MHAGLARWVPPARALRAAAIVVALVIGCGAVGWIWGGEGAGTAALLGAASVLPLALRRPHWLELAWFVAAVAAGSALAVLWQGQALVGAAVAGAVVSVAPIVRRYGAVAGVLAVVVANIGAGAVAAEPSVTGWAVVGGAVVSAVVIRLLPLPAVPAIVPGTRVVDAYTVLLAGLSGVTTAVVIGLGLDHGVWAVIALAMVLVPMSHETVARARPRIVGTVIGALAGSALAASLPAGPVIAVGLVALLAGIAHIVAGRQHQSVAFTAMAVVALVGAGHASVAVGAGFERIGFTIIGTAVAVGAGLLLVRVESRSGRARQ